MSSAATRASKSGARARCELNRRLQERRPEIEQAALTRVYAIAEPVEAADPLYADGLRSAVSAALDYGFAAIEHGDRQAAAPVPVSLLAQARLAARAGVSLDTVLRRYFAGYTLFGDFLVQEAEGHVELTGAELKRLLRTQATYFDRLVVAVSEEYGREAGNRPAGSQQRRASLVKRLLAGDLADTSSLGYELEAVHVGLVMSGDGAPEAVGALAQALERRLLLVPGGGGIAWAWLGGRSAPDFGELERLAATLLPGNVVLTLGEPAEGLAGWRFTHRQAMAALPVAVRGGGPFVRYREVALLAAVLQDELLVASLCRLYLEPLEEQGDEGGPLQETLRAYVAAHRNTSSAAAKLGASRNTVAARIASIEGRLGRPIASCAADLEVALSLAALKQAPAPSPTEQSPQGLAAI